MDHNAKNGHSRSGDFHGSQFGQLAKLPQSLSERDRHIPDLLSRLCVKSEFRLLDIGCGLGKVARCAKDLFPKATISGIDISPTAIEKASGFRPDIDYRVCGELDLPFEEAYFDYATCRMSMHHYLDMPDHLREVRRVLKPGGVYLIMDIVPEDPVQAAHLNDVFLSADRDAPGDGHVQFRTFAEYEGLFGDTGFSVDRTIYSGFPVKWAKTTDYYRAIGRHFARMPSDLQRQVHFFDDEESISYCLRMGSMFARSPKDGVV